MRLDGRSFRQETGAGTAMAMVRPRVSSTEDASERGGGDLDHGRHRRHPAGCWSTGSWIGES